MQTRENPSAEEFKAMQAMLSDPTPKERASSLDPNFITEDEADIIVAMRRIEEKRTGNPSTMLLRNLVICRGPAAGEHFAG